MTKSRELESRLVEEWKISAIEIQKLIATMPDRIQALILVDTQNNKCSFQLYMGLLCYDVYFEYYNDYLFLYNNNKKSKYH